MLSVLVLVIDYAKYKKNIIFTNTVGGSNHCINLISALVDVGMFPTPSHKGY